MAAWNAPSGVSLFNRDKIYLLWYKGSVISMFSFKTEAGYLHVYSSLCENTGPIQNTANAN